MSSEAIEKLSPTNPAVFAAGRSWGGVTRTGSCNATGWSISVVDLRHLAKGHEVRILDGIEYIAFAGVDWTQTLGVVTGASGGCFTLVPAPSGRASPLPLALPEVLGRIQHYLSLSTTALALVLQVERATIYNWRKGSSVRANNQERIDRMHALADRWWAQVGHPIGRATWTCTEAGKRLFALLESADVPAVDIDKQLAQLAAVVGPTSSRPKRESIADRARRLGVPQLSDEEREANRHFLDHRERIQPKHD